MLVLLVNYRLHDVMILMLFRRGILKSWPWVTVNSHTNSETTKRISKILTWKFASLPFTMSREAADFTTDGQDRVVCQCCKASFPKGTDLFYMHDRNPTRPGKYLCSDCHQHQLQKTASLQCTQDQGAIHGHIAAAQRQGMYLTKSTIFSYLFIWHRLLTSSAYQPWIQ